MNYFSYKIKLYRLSKKKDKEGKEFKQKVKEARKEGGSAKAHEVSQTERVDLDFSMEDIAILKTNYLSQKINKTIYSMPQKPFATGQNDFWQQSHMTGEWYLTDKGCVEVHHLLEKVSTRKLKYIGVFTALIMALLGIYQLFIARSERLDAANALLKANEALKITDELKVLAELQDAIVKAQVGDRASFEKLTKWYEDKSHPYGNVAENVIASVVKHHNQDLMFSESLEAYGYDLSKLKTIDDILQEYKTTKPYIKKGFIQYLWDKRDIPKNDKVRFLINVIKHDDSLEAVAKAGLIINDNERHPKFNAPLDIEGILQWWEENKDKYN